MFNRHQDEDEDGQERLFSWRRIKITILGSLAAVVLGLVVASLYTYSQYGGTPFDGLLGRGKSESPDVGKLAYTKGTDFFIGVSKSAVFGVLVALVGCLRGMQSGRSAAAVGLAATSAVVTSIVLIIVVDAIFAVMTNILGI